MVRRGRCKHHPFENAVFAPARCRRPAGACAGWNAGRKRRQCQFLRARDRDARVYRRRQDRRSRRECDVPDCGHGGALHRRISCARGKECAAGRGRRHGGDRQPARFCRAQHLCAELRSRRYGAERLQDSAALAVVAEKSVTVALCRTRSRLLGSADGQRIVESQGAVHFGEWHIGGRSDRRRPIGNSDRIMYLRNYLAEFHRATIEGYP